jgi:phosphoribosylformylglycinamidine cyclo-ligase
MSGITYRDSGVDIGKADTLIGSLRSRIEKTFHSHVLSAIGGFASVVEIPKGYANPLLVSGTDGVGTKLRIAFLSGKHDTVGIDLVAMSANDILTAGAKPLFFLDYFACGHIDEKIYKTVVSGICAGCEAAGCALVGGETAEMPSFYEGDEYELAGFAVGIVEKEKVVDSSRVQKGDRVIALASSGLHSNGFSLVRKILLDIHHLDVKESVEGLDGKALYEELLIPTRIYVKSVLTILNEHDIKGMAHITGGGLPGNISRIIPDGLGAQITLQRDRIPPIFRILEKLGDVPVNDMYSTFNMGVGFVLVVAEADENPVIKRLAELGETAFPLGVIEAEKRQKVVVVETA